MSSFKSRGYKKSFKKLKGYKLNKKYTQKNTKTTEVPINMKSIENMTEQDVENHLKFLTDKGFIEKF